MTYTVCEPDSWNHEPDPQPPGEHDVIPGQTVYWLSSDKGLICSGVVRLVSEGRSPGGEPTEIVVEYGGSFVVRRACQSWDQWYTTPTEAYRAGITELSRVVTNANKSMLSLVDSHTKGGDK